LPRAGWLEIDRGTRPSRRRRPADSFQLYLIEFSFRPGVVACFSRIRSNVDIVEVDSRSQRQILFVTRLPRIPMANINLLLKPFTIGDLELKNRIGAARFLSLP
jgi:hypothetical protein